jgi:ABC-2 type transport system ATP-binding protein
VLALRSEYKMTVLYTTHLMEESQELSDRIAIIDHGEIIAHGTLTELMQQIGEEDRLILKLSERSVPPELVQKIKAQVSGITDAQVEIPAADADVTEETQVVIRAQRGRKALPDVIRIATECGVTVSSVEVREPDLESLFLKLTGRALRE